MKVTPQDEESVKSRLDSVVFVDRLREDMAENPQMCLPSFLEALSRYTRDVPGYVGNNQSSVVADVPSWALFAIFLGRAAVYE